MLVLASVGRGVSLNAVSERAEPGRIDLIARARTPAEVEACVRALRVHPRFKEAMRRMTLGLLEFNERYQSQMRAFPDLAALALGGLAIHLHSSGRLYHRGLQAMMGSDGKGGVISGGRATAVLWRMRSLALIAPDSAFERGKQRFYKPQPAMVETYRSHTRATLEALALLDERAARLLEAWRDEATFLRLNSAMIELLLASIARKDVNQQPLHGVSYMALGIPITLSIVAPAFESGLVAEGPVSVSLSAVARRWDVSRPHARRIVQRLERAGLRIDPADSQRYILTPAFRDAFERYFCASFQLSIDSIEACNAALRRIEGGPRQ